MNETLNDTIDKVNDILVNKFEIPEELVKDPSIQFQELNLDSLDVADMIVGIELATGEKVNIEEFRKVKTLEDVYNIVYVQLNKKQGDNL